MGGKRVREREKGSARERKVRGVTVVLHEAQITTASHISTG